MDALSAIYNGNYMDVTPGMVAVAKGKLKCGKACGSDCLFAEHCIHADNRLAVLLSTFFASALTHMPCPGRIHAKDISSSDKKNLGTRAMWIIVVRLH